MDSTTTTQPSRPLSVLIAGAGIGGLTAALGLRRQGHHVTVFEQSPLARELGAGIAISSNANGILRRLGIKLEDPEHGGVPWLGVHDHHGSELISTVDLTAARAAAPHPTHFVLRRDLHSALKNAATATAEAAPISNESKKETPVKLYTGSRVIRADAAAGTLHLEDGSTHKGDIILGADGMHSRTRHAIAANAGLEPFEHRCSSFRFLVPTETLRKDPLTAPFVAQQTFFQLLRKPGRLMIMYPGAGGAMTNVACSFSNHLSPIEPRAPRRWGWHTENAKEQMLAVFSDYGAPALAVLNHADPAATGRWPLMDLPNLPRWVEGRLALLGDAAHPFLPFMAQGGAMAIEDGGALAAVFPLGVEEDEVPGRLEVWEKLRYHRASVAQQASRDSGTEEAMSGQSADLMPRLREMAMYLEKHDAWEAAEEAINGGGVAEDGDEEDADSDHPTLVGDADQQKKNIKDTDKEEVPSKEKGSTAPDAELSQAQEDIVQQQPKNHNHRRSRLLWKLKRKGRHNSSSSSRRSSISSTSSFSSSSSSSNSSSDSDSDSDSDANDETRSAKSRKRTLKRALKRTFVAQARELKAELKRNTKGRKREIKKVVVRSMSERWGMERGKVAV